MEITIVKISLMKMQLFAVSYCQLFSPQKRGSMFLQALVCVSVCDHND